MKNNVIFFDCDGTILDTFLLIEKVTLQVFKEVLPDVEVTMDEIHAFFGPLLDESFKKYAKDEKQLNECIERYRYYNMAWHEKYVRSYPGIKELLIALQNSSYDLVIVSNKITEAIMHGLKINGIDQLFTEVIGAEKLSAPKPDPTGINEYIAKHNYQRIYFVGDSKYDIMCSDNIKKTYPSLKSVVVTWCKTTHAEFENLGADYIIDQPKELLEVIANE